VGVRGLTFVHTADCHLDAPFVGIGREDPSLAERLRKAQRAVFDDLIALCIERGAAFLVIAGDLYDVAERSLTTRVRLIEQFRRLGNAGVPVFLATGNHDNLEETQRGLSFPPNVRLFLPERPETFFWPDERPVVAITGMSYGRRAIEENLALRFPAPTTGLFNVAVLHCRVEGSPAKETYAPCRLEELLRSGYDYWALGHVHARQVLAEGRTTVVYPGCLQGRQIGETGEKGATAATVDERGGVRLEFAPLNRIEWAEAEVDASGVETDEQLAERFRECRNELISNAAARLEGLIVRWRPVGRAACDTAAHRRVLEMLREDAFEHRPFLWSESVDASGMAPLLDLDVLAKEESARGDLMRRVEQIRGDPAEMERLRECLLDKSGPGEFARELAETEALEKVLDEATWLGLDLLGREREK